MEAKVVCFSVLLMLVISVKSQLRNSFYASTCPGVEGIVRSTVQSHFNSDPTIAPGLLRLHFHDCFVQVCFCIFFMHKLVLLISQNKGTCFCACLTRTTSYIFFFIVVSFKRKTSDKTKNIIDEYKGCCISKTYWFQKKYYIRYKVAIHTRAELEKYFRGGQKCNLYI